MDILEGSPMTNREDAIAYFRRHGFSPEEAELAWQRLDAEDLHAIARWKAAGRPGKSDPVVVSGSPFRHVRRFLTDKALGLPITWGMLLGGIGAYWLLARR